jgi:(S)-sulfolactate dehydrogenase
MPEIVVTEFMDAAMAEKLVAEHDAVYQPDLVDRRADLFALARDARALIVRNRTRVDQELLDACPQLLVIGRLGVGLDNFDLAACAARGVPVFPARGANALAVAEYAIASVLVLRRRCFHVSDQVIAGAWPRETLLGDDAAGACLGILGLGDIGRHVARRGRALGMRVIACDPYVHPDDPAWRDAGAEPVDFDTLLATADALTLHVPLNDETRHIIDAAALARMQPHAVLVNSARGGVIDEAALAAAMRAGKLAGAAIDVFEQEPLSAEAGAKFAGIDNLVLTPHVAGVTAQAQSWTGIMIVDKVLQTLRDSDK